MSFIFSDYFQKLFQTWISERIFEKKKNNKSEKEKVNLFLETLITKAKIYVVLLISLAPLSTFVTSL
jgi:hypothetical protein